MKLPVIDLHCDCLLYLATSCDRTAWDLSSRCSISQLMQGNVIMQVMAAFTITAPQSSMLGWKQVECFKRLLHENQNYVSHALCSQEILTKEKIALWLAFENASTLCAEEEPFSMLLIRLKHLQEQKLFPLYISLTWNMENRFGGGCHSEGVGLKEDGKRLLHAIAGWVPYIDVSHASDLLVEQLFAFIEAENLPLRLIASHSNLRTIHPIARNLPDSLAQEIIWKKGFIGMNLIANLWGGSKEKLLHHIAHARQIGIIEGMGMGADYFYEKDLPAPYAKPVHILFFEEWDTAACYPHLFDFFTQNGISKQECEGLASQNILKRMQEYLSSFPFVN